VWLTLPFYDFCGFRSVAVNSVYKLQFFYIYTSKTWKMLCWFSLYNERTVYLRCVQIWTILCSCWFGRI